MQKMVALTIAVALLAGCFGQAPRAASTPEASPTPSTVALAPTQTPTPTTGPTFTPTPTVPPAPTPTFAPGPVILPTVAIPTRTPRPVPSDPLSPTLDSIGSRISILRSLFAQKSVERAFVSRQEMWVRLLDDLEEDREDIGQSQRLYQALGVLDGDADLFQLLHDALTEAVLGLFDAEENRLYVVQDGDSFGPSEALSYAHEFAHALQQQHFDIHAIGKSLEGEASDRRLAFRALVEGDATLAESAYLATYMSQEERQAIQEKASSLASEAFLAAPHIVRRILEFPYNEGLQFAFLLHRAYNGWGRLNDAYRDPPQSTEHILHPNKYVAGEAPVAVELPDLLAALGEGWRELDQDTFGEFFLRAYLETAIAHRDAFFAAAGWGGDSYALLEGPAAQTALASKIVWDTEDDASEFFDAFVPFMESLEQAQWETPEGEPSARTAVLPGRHVYLRFEANQTLLVVAPDSDALTSVVGAFSRE